MNDYSKRVFHKGLLRSIGIKCTKEPSRLELLSPQNLKKVEGWI